VLNCWFVSSLEGFKGMTRVIYLVEKNQMQKKLVITSLIMTLTVILMSPQVLANNNGIEITNTSNNVVNFSHQQLLNMSKTTVYAELYCYGSIVTSGNWGGVQLSHLLNEAHISSEVASIELIASDGYKVIIPVDLAFQPQIIIAYEKDDAPLVEGYRLILPDFNGDSWIAYVTTIAMSTSAAKHPEVVTAVIGGGSNINKLPTSINPTQTASPKATDVPKQILPPPSSQNSPTIETDNQSNETVTINPVPTIQSNQSSSQQTLPFYAIALALTVMLLATAYLTYQRKQKTIS
jgi:hypothetical protein